MFTENQQRCHTINKDVKNSYHHLVRQRKTISSKSSAVSLVSHGKNMLLHANLSRKKVQQSSIAKIWTKEQGCSLSLDVSVSRRSRDVVSKRLGLVSWKHEKVSVSISSRTENQMSRSRTIGSRLQANVDSFLPHCKITPTSFWYQGVYIVHWFTRLLIYCSASAYQDATWYGCMPRPRRHCVRC